ARGRTTVPLCGGVTHGRSHAPAGAVVHGHVRRDVAAAGWRTGTHDPALEMRVQKHQIHRQDPPGGRSAADLVECGKSAGVWVLLQRESAGGPSAVEPGERADGPPADSRWSR